MIIDAHCDILTKVCDKHVSLLDNHEHFCFKRTKELDTFMQVLAVWIENGCKAPYQRAMEKINAFLNLKCTEIELLTSFQEIEKLSKSYVAILSIEGGEAIEGSMEKLQDFYDKGVRMFGLTWNGRNELADGVGIDNAQGLTPIGIEVVKKANEIGMIIDLSHIAQKGFWDVMELTAKPIVCSHSNAFDICQHPRNLTNDQFRAVIQNNGCVGLNWYPWFLDKEGNADVMDILKHLEHFLSLGGENHIGFGADLDGFENLPNRATGVESYQIILEEMYKRNYSSTLIEKICWKNFNRVFHAI